MIPSPRGYDTRFDVRLFVSSGQEKEGLNYLPWLLAPTEAMPVTACPDARLNYIISGVK